MAYGESNGHVTDDVTRHRKVKLVTANTLRAQYLENSYLATIANNTIAKYLVCCEAVRSAILATAWLLVDIGLNGSWLGPHIGC